MTLKGPQIDSTDKAEELKNSASPSVNNAPKTETQSASPSEANKNPPDKNSSDKSPWAGDITTYERRPWNETARGRLAIRMASRGILGAALYSLAQVKGGRDMEHYDPSHSWADIWKGVHLEGDNKGKRKWLQLLAKSFDSTIGNAIKGTVKFITNDDVKATEAVMFRPTRFYAVKNPGLANSSTFALSPGKKYIWGRSLGAEIVGVTYDFASMSVGDGLAREYLIPLFDPAVDKKWLKRETKIDKDGKEFTSTRLDFGEAGKAFAKATWRLFTYNAGEDWFAGPIYAYYMKWQRNLIDKHSPGFGFDSDRALNGGSFKVNSEGKITGNYNTEGMLDLMGRFSFYNYLTLIFRESYNKVGSMVTNYWDTGKLPSIHSPESISDGISGAFTDAYQAARYMVKSFIKAYTYMIPASFVFASIRTSQSKDIGLAVHQEMGANGKLESKGPLYFMNTTAHDKKFPSYIQANGSLHGTGRKVDNTFEPDHNNTPKEVNLGLRNHRPSEDQRQVQNPFSFTRTDNGSLEKFAYYDQHTGPKDYITNAIGKTSHTYGDFYKAINTKISRVWNGNPSAQQLAADPALAARVEKSYEMAKNYSRRFSKASLSYTPYFFAKTDVLARRWDNERVDFALNRMIDGATNFNWGEFKAGFGEWMHGLRKEKLEDPKRENEVQKVMNRNDAEGNTPALSQESMTIQNGYQYMPSVRTQMGATQLQERSHAETAQRSMKDIIAEQQAKSTSSWSDKRIKEQNAPTTTQIN